MALDLSNPRWFAAEQEQATDDLIQRFSWLDGIQLCRDTLPARDDTFRREIAKCLFALPALTTELLEHARVIDPQRGDSTTVLSMPSISSFETANVRLLLRNAAEAGNALLEQVHHNYRTFSEQLHPLLEYSEALQSHSTFLNDALPQVRVKVMDNHTWMLEQQEKAMSAEEQLRAIKREADRLDVWDFFPKVWEFDARVEELQRMAARVRENLDTAQESCVRYEKMLSALGELYSFISIQACKVQTALQLADQHTAEIEPTQIRFTLATQGAQAIVNRCADLEKFLVCPCAGVTTRDALEDILQFLYCGVELVERDADVMGAWMKWVKEINEVLNA